MSQDMRSRRFRATATGVACVMAASVIAQVPAPAAAAAKPKPPKPAQVTPSMPGVPAMTVPPPVDATANQTVTTARPVVWPAPGSVEVALEQTGARVRAGDLPVWVTRSGPTDRQAPDGAEPVGPSAVRVQVLDRATTARAGVAGVLLRVGRTDGRTSSDKAAVEIGYEGFQHAYGGDWAGRLQLSVLSECALTTPGVAGCQATVLPTANDRAGKRVSAQVDVAPVSAKTGGTLVALAAGDSSSEGDFKASGLQASATWSAGGAAGNFTWSYPMRVPPSVGGPAPDVGLAYSTQSVDGRTAAANSQPSWAGEGFDFWPGFIERSYKACMEDGVANVGDQCWAGDNATMALGAGGGELVQDGTSGVWRPKNDDGSIVEKLSGAANGDQGEGVAPVGEHWKVTTLDGTEYYFGLNRLPGWAGHQETNSAWTTTVFGNNGGEPCNRSTFAASSCTQAYRWNLDYVVDRHGNTMSFWYSTESNNYARNRTDTAVSSYVRGGWLSEIRYGTRQNSGADSVFAASAPMRVVFGATDRCVTPGSTCTSANPSNWPDVPWDQNCVSTTTCAGKYAPTFWNTKKLSTITTQVWGGSAYRDVDRWTLTHEFKEPTGGATDILWLKTLRHTGLVGGSLSLPSVTFNPDPSATYNRVQTDGSSLLYRYRMSTIDNETGGTLSIGYSLRECAKISLPAAPHSNGMRCFPAFWTKPGATGPTMEYFHKYLVTSVVAADRLGGNPPDTTTYAYLGGPAWHYDESEFTPASRKTWGQWRGYEKVRVTHGQAGAVQSVTEQQYFRGMDEDKQPTGIRDVKITDSDGVVLDDSPWRSGQLRETRAFSDAVAGTVATRKKIDPWQHGPTATRNRNGVMVKAYIVNASQVVDKTALDGGRGWRTTKTVNSFDTAGPVTTGLLTHVDNLGDDSTAADDQCTRYEYARNDAEWMRGYLTRVYTVGVNCATTPNLATQVLSDVRTYYDGATGYGATIDKGDKTREEQRADWIAGVPLYTQVSRAAYDANGRTLEAWDPLDRRTATAYISASGGPVTGLTVTNPMNWTASSTVEPAWGLATRTVDANNRITDLTYDPLGRLAAAWLPGRNKTGGDSANATFTYHVRNTGTSPTAVTTSRLNKNGGYVRSVTLYDGNLNQRQTQSTAPDGGAIITDILRDSRSLAIKTTEPYYTNLGVGTTLFVPQYEPPGQIQTIYDTVGRPTTAIFKKSGAEMWRTGYGYGGDRVDVTPPAGATPTSTITDGRGNTVELRQYHGTTASGTFDRTRYTHTARGDIATMTDAAGNIWRYTYDQRGRRIRAEDPDAGVSINTYDNAGQLLTSTDGRGQTLANSYDLLGRKTQLREGSPTGPVLAEWTWDTILKGQPGSATRYSGGNAYVSRVTGWDAAYRPLTAQIQLPVAEAGLAGTYEWTSTYNIDGSTATQTLPAAGGLAPETLTFGYSDVGLPTTLNGHTPYITGTGYSGIGQLASISASAGGNELGQYWFWEEGTGRLAEQLAFDATAGNVFQDLYYAHDAAGNVTSVADKIVQYGSPGPDETQCFGYDRLRRLTNAWTPSSGNCDTNPTVAALGGPARYWHTYTYDVTGNRRTEVQHASGGDTSRTYAYPAAGAAQPHTLRSVTTSGPGVNRTDSYGYDTAGSTTSRPGASAGQTLTWNSEGRLASVTENGQTTSFLYDADGGRLIRRDSSGTTLYLPGMELTKPAGSGSVSCTRFYTHAGQTVAVRNSAGLHWQVSDHHGTSHMSLNAATMAKTQRRTLPFGGIRGANPTWPSQKGFVGGTNDATIGTIHLGAREYDAATGRFISADAIIRPTDPQQANGYSYANNSPLTFSDPTGLDYCDRHACPGDGGYVDPTSGGGGGGGCYGGNQSASCRDGGGGGSTGGSAGRPCSDGGKGTTSCDSGPPAKPVTRTYKNRTTITANTDGTFVIDGYLLPKDHPDPYALAESVDAERGKTPRSSFANSFEELWWTTLLVGASCDALRRTDNACSFRFNSDVNGDNYIFGRAARSAVQGEDPATALLEALAAAYMFGAARPGPSGAGGGGFVHGTAFDETHNIGGRPLTVYAQVRVDGTTIWLKNISIISGTDSVRGDLGLRGTSDMLRVLRQDLLPRAAAQGFTHLRVTFLRVDAGAATGHTGDRTFPTGGLPGARR